MTELGCKVKNCSYHGDGNLCSRNSIKVEGGNAVNCSDTSCASFEKLGRTKTTNRCDCGNQELSINCAAVNCKFNKENTCTAKSIDIRPSKDKNYGYTECASFEM